jgi:cytochrome c oxidase subunit 4
MSEKSTTAATVPRLYLAVFLALLALTALTILVSYVDLGPVSAPLALLIAAVKATLVILYFMHLREASPLIWVAAGGGFFWLAIMIVLTMSDVATRGAIPVLGK